MSLFNLGCLCVFLWSLACAWLRRTISANITLAVKRQFNLLSKAILAFLWNLPRELASKRHIACVCCQGNKARWLSFQHIRMVYIPMVLFAFFLMAERNMTNCTGLYRIVESGKWLPLLSPKKLVASGGLFGFWRTRQPELTLPTCNYNSFPR